MEKEKLKENIKRVVWFILNPRLLLCVGIAWMITNGWSYVLLGLGTWLDRGWMIAVSGAYLALLWFPFSPEKIVTFALALALLRLLFPRDEKTLALLKEWHGKAASAFRSRREKKKQKRTEKRDARRVDKGRH